MDTIKSSKDNVWQTQEQVKSDVGAQKSCPMRILIQRF